MKPRSFSIAISLLILACVCFSTANAATSQEWRSRSIYQLLTDRFSRTSDTSACTDLSTYCGGTFQGISEHLDYIQGMGFNAIWISPIVMNIDGGYHGYWLKDLYQINPNFGTEKDLVNLISACHKRDIWVMIDVVANHVGPVKFDYSQINPFNSSEHYHSYCEITNFGDQPMVENCRLAGLPDLAQENQFVASTLNDWIGSTINKYQFDGIRIDTNPEVPKSFWKTFVQAMNSTFAIGETFDGRVDYVSSYAQVIGSVVSYPLFFTLRNVFAQQQSAYNIQNILNQYNQAGFPDLSVLGIFIDNHDNARFLNVQADRTLYKNALLFVLTQNGIPIIYYGSEQEFSGGADPNNREPLWNNMNPQSELYKFIQTVLTFKNSVYSYYEQPQIQRYADDQFYAFTRGDLFVATANVGSNYNTLTRTITYHSYVDGTKLCNIFDPSDCIVVVNKAFQVVINGGLPKLYFPLQQNLIEFFTAMYKL